MANATLIPAPAPPPPVVRLELTATEAHVIRALVRSPVARDNYNAEAEAINDALRRVGFQYGSPGSLTVERNKIVKVLA